MSVRIRHTQPTNVFMHEINVLVAMLRRVPVVVEVDLDCSVMLALMGNVQPLEERVKIAEQMGRRRSSLWLSLLVVLYFCSSTSSAQENKRSHHPRQQRWGCSASWPSIRRCSASSCPSACSTLPTGNGQSCSINSLLWILIPGFHHPVILATSPWAQSTCQGCSFQWLLPV